MKKHLPLIFTFLVLCFTLFPLNLSNAQVQRNPVIEACTGTWCQYCPCGHDVIDNILVTMPNAIAIEYHGPTNYGDPWAVFNGNEIIGLMTFSSYPTGIIDRTSAPQSRSAWPGMMNTRFNVPAAVDITMDKAYNKITGALDVTIHATAQSNLTAEYKLSFIIMESGLVYPQSGNTGAGCIGGTNYVHNHVVRSMINGATGEALNGANPWNSGQTISKSIQWTVPASYVADNCELVAFVYKVASPLYLGEIAQAQKWPLVSPDYVATIAATSTDVITQNNTSGEFTVTVKNTGLLDDTYYVEGMIDGPSGWTGEFTTTNGTTGFGEMDSINVTANDSAQVAVSVNPNSYNGFGYITLRFTSKGDSGVIAEARMRMVTKTGIDFLIIDASGEGYGGYLDSSLARVADTAAYGIVSREALLGAGADLSGYYTVAWIAGNKAPVFVSSDVDLLQAYLDQGGRLLITGQDIGYDIMDPAGQSQFASDFYHNYLHANYVQNAGPSYFLTGLTGDPIGDGLAFSTNNRYPRFLDEIAPFDADASGIFQFGGTGPSLIGIKAAKDDYRIVYTAFGLEQIDHEISRDSIAARSFRWLMEGVVTGVDNNPAIVYNYSLDQNYPNPFNPSTRITYSIADAGHTSIKIYDIMGREVTTLVNGYQQPGSYTVAFDAASLSSGMYIYKIESGKFTSSKKMIVLK